MEHGPLFSSVRARDPHRWVIAFFGTLASVLLHAILLVPALFGTSTHAPRPADDPTSSMSIGSNDESTMTLVSLNQSSSESRSAEEIMEMASPAAAALLPVAEPDVALPVALMQADGADDIESSDDATKANQGEHARLFGMYVGQIDARIDRAWIRPRTPVDSVMFICRVRITQDQNGRVQEMEMLHCNGDASWEMSVVRAIQSASPLPAPPDPKVFSHTLTLELKSGTYSPGSGDEGFERK